MTAETIHTCSYSCERPARIRAQRDELVSRMTAPPPAAARGDVRGLVALAERVQYADTHAQVSKDDAGEFVCLPPWLWLEIRDAAVEALAAEGVQAGEVEQALIGAAFLTVLRDPSVAWRDKREAAEFIRRVAETAAEQTPTIKAEAGKVAEYQYRCPKAFDSSWRRMSKGEYDATLATGHACGNPGWTRDVEVRALYTASALSQQPEARGVVDVEAMVDRMWECWQSMEDGRVTRETFSSILIAALTEARNG